MGITLNESTIEELLQAAKTTLDLCNEILNTKPDDDTEVDDEPKTTRKKKTTKKKTTRKKKTAKKKTEPEDDDTFDDDVEDGDNDFSFDDDDNTESDGPSLDDVKAEFKVFVKKFSTTKVGQANAKKVLAKFKAKSIASLDEGDYQAVIDLLRTKK